MLKDKEWTIEKEVVIKKKWIYMLEGGLKREVIQLHYNIPMGGSNDWGNLNHQEE